MRRIVTFILLILGIAACGKSQTPDQATTQIVLNEPAHPTLTSQVKATTPIPSSLSTLAPTPTPSRSITPSTFTTSTPTSLSTSGASHLDDDALITPTQSSFLEVVTRTRSNDSMVMVFIPAGEFIMGSPAGEGGDDEVPQHQVYLSAYWIDRTEVTNDQYRVFVSKTGHEAPTTCDWGDPTYSEEAMSNHPVVCVRWEDARAYCEWAGAQLPTEAEWEKAARGTDKRTYPWGSSFDGNRTNFCDINCEGDHKDISWNDGYAFTAPVGSYPTGASPYGALDMAGNVWEWVADWYGFYYYSKSPMQNPPGPNSGVDKILRGGSWYGFYTNERSEFRASSAPEARIAVSGFRCVVPSQSVP